MLTRGWKNGHWIFNNQEAIGSQIWENILHWILTSRQTKVVEATLAKKTAPKSHRAAIINRHLCSSAKLRRAARKNHGHPRKRLTHCSIRYKKKSLQCTRGRTPCVVAHAKKTHHSHPPFNSLAPCRSTAQYVWGHTLTDPRQLQAINTCWRPNAVADQHSRPTFPWPWNENTMRRVAFYTPGL